MRAVELKLENFRGFEAADLRFDDRLTVLVGVNGSGKSTVLEAVQALLNTLVQTETTTVDRRDGVTRLGASPARASLTVTHEQRSLMLHGVVEQGEGTWSAARLAYDADRRRRGPLPLLHLVPVTRIARDQTPGSTNPRNWEPTEAWGDERAGGSRFVDLFAWFREREDLENELRREDANHADPQLQAVRSVVERFLPGFTNLHVRRPRNSPDDPFRAPVLMVRKGDDDFSFGQLSEGERLLVATVADIARRLAIANPDAADPLAGEGIVLIDEIELHLHPRWQIEVLERFQTAFPNLQFIVTTHSPLVLTRVPREQIRVLQDFNVYTPSQPTRGRDADAILLEVFATEPQPPDIVQEIRAISDLLDEENLADARIRLDDLATKLGEQDAEVVRLRTMLELLAS